jgi:hypothetical protein
MTYFTTDAVTEALHKIVAEKGEDYIYPNGISGRTCFYAQGGAPSCIVGHVIAALEPEAFREIAAAERVAGSFGAIEAVNGFEYGDEIDNYSSTPHLTSDETLEQALSAAQTAQDGGMTWGEAMNAYDRIVGGEPSWKVLAEVNRKVSALNEARIQARVSG